MRCASEDAEWFCARYKNHGRIEDYLGDSQPYWVEVVAVRCAQWLNGCRSLDWTYENWIVALVRETGPGFRMGFFLTSLYIVVVTSFTQETPLVFQYDLHHPQKDMRYGNVTLVIAFYLWTLDFGLLTLSYYLVRHHGTPPRPGENGECTPFFRIPTRQLREQRDAYPQTAYLTTMRGLYAFFFTAHFLLAVFAMHTVLSHMYVKRNVWFAWLLFLKAVMVVLASVDDLTHIGSPWGLQECSKTASVLLSFRGLFLMPLTVVWSAAAAMASFPPSYCREC